MSPPPVGHRWLPGRPPALAGLGAEIVLGREGVVWWEVKQLDGAMVADGQPKRQEHAPFSLKFHLLSLLYSRYIKLPILVKLEDEILVFVHMLAVSMYRGTIEVVFGLDCDQPIVDQVSLDNLIEIVLHCSSAHLFQSLDNCNEMSILQLFPAEKSPHNQSQEQGQTELIPSIRWLVSAGETLSLNKQQLCSVS